MKIRDDRLLDEKAADVYKALKHCNVPIPSALRTPPSRETLFHNAKLSLALCESFYGRGFVDVDGTNHEGLTPLMILGPTTVKKVLLRASWLVSKGADLGRKPDQSDRMYWDPSITAAHKLFFVASYRIYLDIGQEPTWAVREIQRTRLFRFLEELEEDCQALLRDVLSSKSYDNCLCACSSHGCVPATSMLKGITSVVHEEFRLWMIEWIERLLGHRHETWQWLSREIIRYETFKNLGLTHTCCRMENWLPGMPLLRDSVECEEIRDEERFLIDELNTLVEEFQEKYTELGVPVSDFLKGYWKTRMEEVKNEEGSLDDEEIAKIRDVGVIVES